MTAAAKHTVFVVALVLLLAVTSIADAGSTRTFSGRDRVPPTAPKNLHVVSATPNLVYVAWDPSQDDGGIAGYVVYGDTGRAYVTAPAYTVTSLGCGESTAVAVAAYDRAGNRSPRTTATVSTAACPDTQAPTTPSGFRQAATTQDAVVVAWDPASDDVGVVEYGVYRGVVRVASVAQPTVTLSGLSCGSTYAYTVDAADAAGNRSALGSTYVQTASCSTPTPTPPPSGDTWTFCSNEHERCVFTGTKEVRYGLNGTYTEPRTFTDGVECTNAVFGDPLVGTPKDCEVRNTDSSPSPPPSGDTWTFCSNEHERCVFTGSKEVRYGLNGTYTAPRTFTDGVECTNAVFGDPLVGTPKRCEVRNPGPSPSPPTDTQPPSTPSGLAASNVTQSGLTLSWNASTDNVQVTGYDLYRNGTKVASPSAPGASQSGLACATSYTFAVEALDAAGNRSSRATLTTSTSACSPPPPATDTQAPSTPSGLAASNVTQSGLTLSWNASTDNVQVTGYDLYRNGTKVASPSAPGASQSGLACATSYTFAVEALDAAGNRSSRATLTTSTSACSTPPPATDTQAPSTPSGLAASNVTQSGLTLSWNASTDNVQVTGYDLYRNGTKVASPSAPGASQSGLACATSYTFAVEALDAAGNRSSRATLTTSTSACSTPPPPPTDTQPPSTPTGLGVSSATRTSASLSWNPSTDNVAVAGYRSYRNSVYQSTTTQPPTTVSGLSCGTAYTFEVEAFDAPGNASNRAAVIGSTLACPDTQAPSAPAGVLASSRTANSIALTWSPSTDNVGVTGYGLYRGGSLVGTGTTTTGIFAGLTCNTNYTLAVDAVDAAGNRSAPSTVMVSTTACPDTTPPSTPTGVAASNVSQTGLTLSWNASTDNVGVSGYDVYRNATKMATVTSRSSSQTGLACGTSYTFAVEALDAAGNRSPRAQMSASTSACSSPPPPPSGEPAPIAGQGYSKVFGDDFDALSNTSWGQGIWYDPGAPSGSIYAQDGILHLVSRRSQGYPEITVSTEGGTQPVTFTNGYFEARMRWTKGAGAWPAFWLLSYRHAVNPSYPSINPYCQQNGLPNPLCYSAELDVFEGQGTEPTVYYGTSHRNSCDCYGVPNQQNSNNYTNTNTDLTTAFHTYGMLWTSTTISWYLDGQLLKSASAYDSTNQPMFLLLQMWIGGWTSGTTSATPDELQTEVDWVHVWQK